MGGGSYSTSTRTLRAASLGYTTKAATEIFTARNINSAMNPYGIIVRESRDSAEHPSSLAVVLGLDVTGSMGTVPHFLVKEGLPHMMESIIKKGIPDPQLLFMGIGDHECDQAPLQVGQFESSDELLDKWLTELWLEGHGGGNDGESYMLPWYFAARHTAIDCHEKRGKKGFLFTIGDEPVLPSIPANFLKQLMGEGQYEDYSSVKLLAMASEKYNVYHIHIRETSSGSRQRVIDGWRQLLSDNLLIADRKNQVAEIIADTVCGKSAPATTVIPAKKTETTPAEMML
jgi:hypothetical protein